MTVILESHPPPPHIHFLPPPNVHLGISFSLSLDFQVVSLGKPILTGRHLGSILYISMDLAYEVLPKYLTRETSLETFFPIIPMFILP